MKKKFLSLVIAVVAFAINVQAQQPVEQCEVFDNVSVTIKGGVTTPLQNPVDDPRGVFGVEFEKMITPVFGIGVEGEWTVDTSTWPGLVSSSTMIDHQYVGVYGVTNLMNLISGYKGLPRKFEVETVLGVGWGHSYGVDDNVVLTKTGLNLNYNFGSEYQWTAALKPAVVWNMNASSTQSNYNINRTALQLQVGLTYHFNGSNGRHFVLCDKVATQDEIDALNKEINELRAENQRISEEYSNRIDSLIEDNEMISKSLQECEGREVVVNNIVIAPIQFKKGSYELVNSESSINVLAELIKSTDGPYSIVGYASEEGDEGYNKELSLKRAEVVANALLELGVNNDQITVVGEGETTKFGEDLELNRVVIIR